MSHTRWIVVLGDQLSRDSRLFTDLNPATDRVWMCEAVGEARRGRNHQQRLVLFFAAMRHLRDELRARGVDVDYRLVSDADQIGHEDWGLAEWLAHDLAHAEADRPESVVLMEAGDWAIETALLEVIEAAGCRLDWRVDQHFMASREAFARWAEGRRSLTLEYFYRSMRKRHDVLMDGDQPVGGAWNFDKDNRAAFGADGPSALPEHPHFAPDALTEEVIATVAHQFADHPGDAQQFHQPVTPAQAQIALDDFIAYRLPVFGTYQDAIWTGEPLLYHARLSAALNLHLLDPRDCVAKAVAAYESGAAPLNAVEGFVRQILGWREFVRGLYWLKMPDYANGNALEHHAELPEYFWTGQTDMVCVADAMQGVLRHGYAHHIQRLMVLGLFAQLYGAHPYAFHQWHMAMYLDAVDWVSLPNTLGMSQYGDGGVVGTKPYCASGAYIDRQSNACGQCRYNPRQATGDQACPFTTLYWDFLDRHETRLGNNRRMVFQYKNLQRKSADERALIREQAEKIRSMA